jgi:hypothetical protein
LKHVTALAVMALACGTVLGAQAGVSTPKGQTQQPGNTQPNEPHASKPSDSETMTLTGCLQRGGATGAQTSGSSSATPSSAPAGAGAFVLTDASMTRGVSSTTSTSGSSPSGVTATAGSTSAGVSASSSAAGGAGARGSTYMLEGNTTELSRHVNKRVEVTGQMAGATSGSRTSGAGSATTGSGTPSGNRSGSSGSSTAAGHQRVQVSSVREIGGECQASAGAR